MDPPAVLPPDIWERTPPEAQASIRALEVRVAALEGGLQALQEQLQQGVIAPFPMSYAACCPGCATCALSS